MCCRVEWSVADDGAVRYSDVDGPVVVVSCEIDAVHPVLLDASFNDDVFFRRQMVDRM